MTWFARREPIVVRERGTVICAGCGGEKRIDLPYVSMNASLRYVPPTVKSGRIKVRAHLIATCDRCGYEWVEQTYENKMGPGRQP